MSEKNYIERYWRDAKPEDAIKDPPMEARFEGIAFVGKLVGWKGHGQLVWCDENSMWHTHCQVYDAPDPGEGWRLIDTKKETKQDEDEYLSYDGSWYRGGACFEKNLTYRRRITPTVTYIPFTWEDREQLRGKKVLAKEPHRQVEYTCNVFQLNDDGSFFVDEFHSVWLCKNAIFVDTGKPVGKEVTQ